MEHNAWQPSVLAPPPAICFCNTLNSYQAASRVLRLNTTLQLLDLKHCGMDLESAYVVAKGLGCNSTLETLILDGNPIGQNGARQIMVSGSVMVLWRRARCEGWCAT
jgi:hypothetical protein